MSIPGPEDISRHELPNGIVVLVRENRASPSVVVSGYLEVGSYDEEAEQAGLAAFTASMLTRGTAHRTFDQVYEEVESVGATIGVSPGIHHTRFGGRSLAEDLPLILGVLADVVRNPSFPSREVEKLRGEILTDLEERAHDTRRMAALTFRELCYPPTHPYGHSLVGYAETTSALARNDLVDFYQGGFGPQGMIIAVIGAVGTDEAMEQVSSAFGDWDGQTYHRDPLPPVSRPKEVHQ
ncbi:MAG: pitrilysin family protein, partial [Anaerolineae bacterium]